jgi:hypothetical protein
MKHLKLLFFATLAVLALYSCEKEETEKKMMNEVNLDTVSVSGTSFTLTWDAGQTDVYTIEVYNLSTGGGMSFTSSNIYATDLPYTVDERDLATEYQVQVYKYDMFTGDESMVAEMLVTTKASDDDGTGNGDDSGSSDEVLEIQALSVPDGGEMVDDRMHGWSIVMSIQAIEGWNQSSDDAKITLYLGDSEDNMQVVDGYPIDWYMEMGSSNAVEFFTSTPDDGTYYWQIEAEFDIDGDVTTRTSEVYSFYVGSQSK